MTLAIAGDVAQYMVHLGLVGNWRNFVIAGHKVFVWGCSPKAEHAGSAEKGMKGKSCGVHLISS